MYDKIKANSFLIISYCEMICFLLILSSIGYNIYLRLFSKSMIPESYVLQVVLRILFLFLYIFANTKMIRAILYKDKYKTNWYFEIIKSMMLYPLLFILINFLMKKFDITMILFLPDQAILFVIVFVIENMIIIFLENDIFS